MKRREMAAWTVLSCVVPVCTDAADEAAARCSLARRDSRDVDDDCLQADDWLQTMTRVGATTKELRGPLNLRRFKDPTYVLLSPCVWSPNTEDAPLKRVDVPAGFVTDFASVPRVFWSIFRPDGNYAYAAVIHDFLYWQQDRPKVDADRIFRSAMRDLRINDRQSAILFHAVDTFGGGAWESNAKVKAGGEKRTLSRLPDDSLVTWQEWKTVKGVFE